MRVARLGVEVDTDDEIGQGWELDESFYADD